MKKADGFAVRFKYAFVPNCFAVYQKIKQPSEVSMTYQPSSKSTL